MSDLYCPYCQIGIDDNQMNSRHCNNCSHDFDVYHVLPNNDKKDHIESHNCLCYPTLTSEGYNFVCVHHSWDGREGVEWANEVLNQ